ncbi:hypothetical protein EAH79_12415 [Sphingomonas koreensis]|nr:hypothetical protein EAH79_12415 [Sphingomonas koreensis]
MSLAKAVASVQKIFDADRQAPVDRAVAAKHVGYAGQSGASDKALASLAHYGLLEKAGKGETRVTQLAVDILHPDTAGDRRAALRSAGLNPGIFQEIFDRYDGRLPSEEALRSYLLRAGFQNIAINPVVNAYAETFRYLEQEKAFESRGADGESGEESAAPDTSSQREDEFGGAKVGDLIQWEVGGALQMEKPMRVRAVSDDGQWVAVEGSETGIPMSEVMVQERATAPAAVPPTFKLTGDVANEQLNRRADETEWMRNKVGKATTVSLLVSGGDMGAKEIGKLIKLLQAQQAVLADDDEEEDG